MNLRLGIMNVKVICMRLLGKEDKIKNMVT